ncbi:hypothetical protein F9V60_22490 [Salmonella enterica subsp. enterica serovar Virchow]|uniref:hypothetical protein n=1 Tax=Enterobacterales TaxID=91347 RepID=UPI000966E764|nr:MULTISPECIES: hypothetical protein [Enterobacterales]ECS2986249.1 hypothetical protein [Salmonella enterica subsp. enterica serovar Reading]EDB3234683.1 hypothetical protein [Salmonella enterica subsp. enterica serovar Virchow]EKC8290664.1 hypothetical protein [Escherichia coli]ECU6114005.1 hypothetical protein [Salmonella enterica subsp. enterica serovar Reading]MCL8564347.1 hypothetical protein [Proteus mirabilis]
MFKKLFGRRIGGSSEIIEKLNFARSVGKRLDEHREVVEAIERETNFFHEPTTKWHLAHMATQDDYLMRLYFIVHKCWPDEALGAKKKMQTNGEYVRPRPLILGPCGLPEYTPSKRGKE